MIGYVSNRRAGSPPPSSRAELVQSPGAETSFQAPGRELGEEGEEGEYEKHMFFINSPLVAVVDAGFLGIRG